MTDLEMKVCDKFACHAMQELLHDDLAKELDKQMGFEWVAKYAYIIANQMMEERSAYYKTQTS